MIKTMIVKFLISMIASLQNIFSFIFVSYVKNVIMKLTFVSNKIDDFVIHFLFSSFCFFFRCHFQLFESLKIFFMMFVLTTNQI